MSVGSKLAEKIDDVSKNNNMDKSNFLPDSSNISNFLELLKENVNGLDSYPLNLLFDVSTLINCAMFFLITIINVFIAIFLKNNNIFNYLPRWLDPNNSKIGRVLEFFY
uniref:Uncharacterized protein n=1 Tax=Hericium coralloides TaxID=100756 RepID=A0A1P8NNL6_HERCO|nr:hypothetical protein [Hericium coralloides]APX41114.1 hypothetical protein [Hericium coralloides]